MPTVAPAPQPVKYKMPVPALGEDVLFYTAADQNMAPQCGKIVEVGGCSVTVRVMQFHGNDITKYDVCHLSDPRLNNPNIKANGSWDFHPNTKLLKDLAERVAALEKAK